LIEAIKQLQKANPSDEGIQNWVNDNVPEFKESEDERIRKELIAIFKGQTPYTSEEDAKRYIAWLEKQGKILRQRADVIIANMLDDKIDGIQRELIEFAANAIEAHWLEIIKSADYYAQRIRNIIDEQDEQKSADKVEPKYDKSAWSEEDEKMFDYALDMIEWYSGENESKSRCASNWLKSIKDRYIWRPSYEQMHYLSWIANRKLGDNVIEQEASKHLNELYEDLKKLREE
jgi:hypothetical protein